MKLQVPQFDIVEEIYSSARTLVLRARRRNDGRPVILKTVNQEFPAPGDLARLAWENEVLNQLAGTRGFPVGLGLVRFHNNVALTVADEGGTSFARELEIHGPLTVGHFLKAARRVVEALAALHSRGFIHKDVNPRNLLVLGDFEDIRLIDFGMVSPLTQEANRRLESNHLEGSLPYLSPEQTGRMNRDLDFRADFYSLGVTFFQLLSGVLPLQASSVLEWIYKHLSVAPSRLADLAPGVPDIIGRIVEKLMAKNPEDRYQSAQGLLHDLEKCERSWSQWSSIPAFDLGTKDVAATLSFHNQIVGRIQELKTLLRCVERVSGGERGVVLVEGDPGIGKSALVQELEKHLVHHKGFFLRGKFDQFGQDQPYSALLQALEQLVDELLTESESGLQDWRNRILQAVGENAGVLTDFFPPLTALIGVQELPTELAPTESKNRFLETLRRFLQVFTTKESPILLFLDDLQWIDPPTLAALGELLGHEDTAGFLLIGAVRPGEVGPEHPLTPFLQNLDPRLVFQILALSPLSEDVVSGLISQLLSRDKDSCAALSAHIYRITLGNPLYLWEFLRHLVDEKKLRFDPGQGFWEWDEAQVLETSGNLNIIEFMLDRIRRLNQESLQCLFVASILGDRFDLSTLSVALGQPTGRTAQDLLPLLREKLILPLSESYLVAPWEKPTPGEGTSKVGYRFLHDRVRQAAYTLFPPERRQEYHLRIARYLLRPEAAPSPETSLLATLQYNQALELVTDSEERAAAARLNLQACRQAQGSAAYASAFDFSQFALRFLPENTWSSDYRLAFEVHKEASASAYLTGRLDLGETLCEDLLKKVSGRADRAEVRRMQLVQYSFNNKMREAIEVGCQALEHLGLKLKPEPGIGDLLAALVEVKMLLGGSKGKALVQAPALEDRRIRFLLGTLVELIAPAYLLGKANLFGVVALKQVALSLKHGLAEESISAFVNYAALMAGLGDWAGAEKFGDLALALQERFRDKAWTGRLSVMYGLFTAFWTKPWDGLSGWFRKAVEQGFRSGDFLYAAFSAGYIGLWDPEVDLPSAIEEAEKFLPLIRKARFSNAVHAAEIHQQFRKALVGKTADPLTFDDGAFSEERCLAVMKKDSYNSGLAIFHIFKTKLLWFHGAVSEAWKELRLADKYQAALLGSPYMVDYHFFAFLLAAELSRKDPRYRSRLKKEAAIVRGWARKSLPNFDAHALLAEAELERLAKNPGRAAILREQALQKSLDAGNLMLQALSWEKCAEGGADEGRLATVKLLGDKAARSWSRWGAEGRAELVRGVFRLDRPRAAPEDLSGPSALSRSTTVMSESFGTRDLDIQSFVKASQSIHGEIVLERMLHQLMNTLAENSGAQRVVLLLKRGRDFFLEAEISPGQEVSLLSGKKLKEVEKLPHSLFQFVIRKGETFSTGDLSQELAFRADPYLQSCKVLSALCTPLMYKGTLSGLLYLENNLTKGVFDKGRVRLLQLLSAQIAVSLENGFLYSELKKNFQQLENANSRLNGKNQLFFKFVPVQFLHFLKHTPEDTGIATGEWVEMEMSVLFADIRDFTGLAESMKPEETLRFVNSYLARMVPLIEAEGGFVDKYIGDAIMALFEKPDQAVRAGQAMVRHLKVYNQHRESVHYKPISIGVGINTGMVVLGTVGDQKRIQTTVIGDTVNLAARTEELTKEKGHPLLLTAATKRRLSSESYPTHSLGLSKIKGKNLEIEFFAVEY